jgi:hypothetical protein
MFFAYHILEEKLECNETVHQLFIHFKKAYEPWSLILREECKVRVFENRALSRMLGPRRNEVTGEWRRLHNEELHNLYS